MKKLIISILILLPCTLWADQSDKTSSSYLVPIPKPPTHVNWTFTGLASTENGEYYGYFFIMQQENQLLRARVGLLDQRTNSLIFYYENESEMDNLSELKWKVGKAFLKHNLINESWVFGVKNLDNKGFNFKVDMLQKSDQVDQTQSLRSGIDFIIRPMNRLNGHIQIGKNSKEQFVMADNGWFVKSWLSTEQSVPHKVRGIFCRMNDGSGFYSTVLQEQDAKHAALAEWLSPEGSAIKMSQFVAVDLTTPEACRIKISVPQFNIKFNNLLFSQSIHPGLYAGFFKDGYKGFCLLNEQLFARNYAELEPRPLSLTSSRYG